MPLQWFSHIPAEIRSTIYGHFFAGMEVQYNSDRPISAIDDTRIAPLNLFLSSKQVKEDTEPIFWRSVEFIYEYNGPEDSDNNSRYNHTVPPPHHQDRFHHIQFLTFRGYLTAEDLEKLTTIVLGPADITNTNQQRHMQYLCIESDLDPYYGYYHICNILSRAKNRINHLELSLDFYIEFHNMIDAEMGQSSDHEFPEDRMCVLTIKNTYDVDIDREEADFHPLLEETLQQVHGDDFAKVKLAWKSEGGQA